MASLAKCQACNGQVSPKAKACPSCGHPVPRRTSATTWILTAIAAVIIFVVVLAATQTVDSNNKRQADDLVECIRSGRTGC